VIFNEKVIYKDKDNTYIEVHDVPETPITDTPQPKESIKNNND